MLSSSDNPDGYINASHISYDTCVFKYIAAQAPLSTTIKDFWQMILENNIEIVSMLCKCVEMGMVKCEKYWEDEENNGKTLSDDNETNISAVQIEQKVYEDYIWRKLRIKWKKDDETIERIIHHLNYTEWPDHGCPNGEKNVLAFVDLLDKLRKEQSPKSPILLHCRHCVTLNT